MSDPVVTNYCFPLNRPLEKSINLTCFSLHTIASPLVLMLLFLAHGLSVFCIMSEDDEINRTDTVPPLRSSRQVLLQQHGSILPVLMQQAEINAASKRRGSVPDAMLGRTQHHHHARRLSWFTKHSSTSLKLYQYVK